MLWFLFGSVFLPGDTWLLKAFGMFFLQNCVQEYVFMWIITEFYIYKYLQMITILKRKRKEQSFISNRFKMYQF